MFFSETWLKPNSTMDCHLFMNGFSILCRDRAGQTHGGGILVYVKNSLKYRRRTDFEHTTLECVTVEVSIRRGKFLIFCCYRPPDHSVDNFFNTLSLLLSKAESESATTILMGDFNAKHPSWDPNSSMNTAGTRMNQLLLDFSLSQFVSSPTRAAYDGSSLSTLDLFCTTRPDLVHNVTVSAPVSDHCCVNASLSVEKYPCHSNRQHSKPPVMIPDFSKTNWNSLRTSLLKCHLLESIQGTTDVDVAWSVWKSIVYEIIKRHVPLRTVRTSCKNKYWWNSDLRKLSRKKERLWSRAKRTRSQGDWSAYKKIRNKYTEAFRRARTAYIFRKRSQLEAEVDGSHRWWSVAKDLAGIKKSSTAVPELHNNGAEVSSDFDKANLLASFFASQCTCPNPNTNNSGAPYPLVEGQQQFDFQPITMHQTLQKLQTLPVSKATADPMIPNSMLRECAGCVAPSLTYLFNLSLSTNVFPKDWKVAVVIPLFKHRGSPNEPSNYRPISLLHAVAKVLDDLVSESLLKHLTKSKLLSNHQFGFLPKRSTVTQLVYIVDRWTKALDSGRQTYAVFMDFMKAFDRVWHPGLLFKLQSCGVSLSALTWFRSYLSHRSFSVRLGSVFSQPYQASAGVPQGSHLGPILFLVFVNDLTDTVSIDKELFADDALIHFECDRQPTDTDHIVLQSEVTKAESWAVSWHGKFGNAKTKLMRIHSRRLQPGQAVPPEFFIDTAPIAVVEEHRHLGVTLSSSLDWKIHIQGVIAKSSKKAGLLRWMAKDLTVSAAMRLYTCYVRPTLEYASPVWHGSLTASDSLALERIQCSVARTLLNAAWDTPKEEILRRLTLPSLRWRREILSMALFFELLQTRPAPLCDCLFTFAKSKTNRSLRKPYQILLPYARSTRYTKSFFYRSALLWNSLPHAIQSLTSKTQFKAALEKEWERYKYSTHTNIPIPDG